MLLSNTASLFFYLGIYGISALLMYSSNKSKHVLLFTILSLMLPICMAAFRKNGTDIDVYVNFFHYIKDTSWLEIFSGISLNSESGLKFLAKLTSILGDERLFLGVTAAVTLIPVYSAIKNQFPSIPAEIATFLFLTAQFTTSLNIIRQMIAVALVFWGVRYIYERRFASFMLIIVLAASFHVTAWLVFPFYFISDRSGRSIAGIKTIFAISIMLLIMTNLPWAIQQLTHVGVFEKYSVYDTYDIETMNRSIIVNFFVFLIVFWHRKLLIKFDDRNKLLILFSGFALLFGFSGFLSPFIKRFVQYFDISSIVLLAQIPLVYDKKSQLIVKILVYIYAITLFVIVFYILGQSFIIPYKTI